VPSLVSFSWVLCCPGVSFCRGLLCGNLCAISNSTKHADSIDLELEVDPLNVDHFSCTPLVRKRLVSLAVMAHAFNPRIQEAEAGKSFEFEAQPGLQSEF
jgi:hypothetical protein